MTTHTINRVTIYEGDCLQSLRAMPDESVHCVVTDPPYGLSFMGKKWDYDVPAVEVWQECLRVLKPGGHLLAFAGTRTQHRMAVRIEDAGFEIRDMIAWVYGSGFPKSLDVSKAIDKAAGARGHDSVGFNVAGKTSGLGVIQRPELRSDHPDYVKPQGITPEARQWQGWGTALKPALEPITVARKPLCGTVAENVLQHGTGGLNVDGCRVGTDEIKTQAKQKGSSFTSVGNSQGFNGCAESTHTGRWPANLIHDGSDEVVGLFPEATGGAWPAAGSQFGYSGGERKQRGERTEMGDTGSAARFFYCAKADASERRNSKHPTVKPLALMRYLCRLVCPPDGIVLDPFCGSGTTLEAARLEGFQAIGCELNPEYIADCKERLKQGVLF